MTVLQKIDAARTSRAKVFFQRRGGDFILHRAAAGPELADPGTRNSAVEIEERAFSNHPEGPELALRLRLFPMGHSVRFEQACQLLLQLLGVNAVVVMIETGYIDMANMMFEQFIHDLVVHEVARRLYADLDAAIVAVLVIQHLHR